MAITESKPLSRKDRLEALALFTMAKKHYVTMREYELALGEHLGLENEGSGYFGVLSDSIYEENSDFSRVMKKIGF